jgi:hypothetical protein
MLDDKDPEQRKRGITAANSWLEVADCVVVYCDNGITPGMAIGLVRAGRLGKQVRLRWLSGRKEMVIENNQDTRAIGNGPWADERDGEVMGL